MKNNIKAEIVAHSKRANTGEEIITYKLTFPRIILSEVNTYKMLEKNTSSSRAIPFEKMVEVVEREPFIPLAWMLEHKGMQGAEYLTNKEYIKQKEEQWLRARDKAVTSAKLIVSEIVEEKSLKDGGMRFVYETKIIPNTSLSKNYGNRLLEPFMWVTQLCTGTRESFEHLFDQRCPIYDISNDVLRLAGSDTKTSFKSKKEVIKKFPQLSKKDNLWWLQRNKGQAEIHFMDLAEKMYDALNESEPDILKEGEWHIPFQEEIWKSKQAEKLEDVIKMSCAMTARVSYTTINDNEVLTLEKAKKIYDKCVESGHFSVVSHCAKCMTDYEYDTWIKGKCEKSEKLNILAIPNEAKGFNKNLRGFVSLRQYIEDKSVFNYE